ncbi:PH domain-containing protein [Nocardia sp. NPDC056100]|uniref:PH domain-containing protein n=1 Tax=Nocardia sp. NPDC056100 TaxID=3345712 RepID=UPI0035DD8A96
MTTDPQLSWSTPPAALVVCGLGGLVMAVAAVVTSDNAGRLLIGLAALGLLFLAAMGLRQRPRLAVETGPVPKIVVRGLTGPRFYTPDQVLRARVVQYRRLGRRMPMLEMDVRHDGEERLIIFGRWDLGARPESVLDSLRPYLVNQ